MVWLILPVHIIGWMKRPIERTTRAANRRKINVVRNLYVFVVGFLGKFNLRISLNYIIFFKIFQINESILNVTTVIWIRSFIATVTRCYHHCEFAVRLFFLLLTLPFRFVKHLWVLFIIVLVENINNIFNAKCKKIFFI